MKEKLRERWNGTKPITRYIVMFLVVLLIGSAFVMTAQPGTKSVLYTNLNTRDSNDIVRELITKQVNYELQDGNSTILVDGTDVAKLRVELGVLGLPRNKADLSDVAPSIGETSYDKQKRQEAKTISDLEYTLVKGIDVVHTAEVTLTFAEESKLFKTANSDSKATVLLGIERGMLLDEKQIKGIQKIVSAAVPNMSPEDVAIVDTNGALLSEYSSGGQTIAGNMTKQQQIVVETENRIKNDVMESLSKVFGYGHVTMNVRAEINFDEIVRNIETYDPNNVLVGRERETETMEKNGGTDEIEPGTEANGEVPDYEINDGNNGDTLEQNKERIIENFEVSKTVQTIRENPELTNLNVVLWINKTMDDEEILQMEKAIAVAAGVKDLDGDGVYDNGEVKVVPVIFNQNTVNNPELDVPKETTVFGIEMDAKNKALAIFILVGGAFLLITIVVLFAKGRKETKVIRQINQTNPITTKQQISTENNQLTPEETEKEMGMEEQIFTGISKQRERTQSMDTQVDEETYKRQKSLSDKARDVAQQDPEKTTEYIKRLIGEG